MATLHQAILEVLEQADTLNEYELLEWLHARGVECDTGELHMALVEMRDEGRVTMAWQRTVHGGHTAQVSQAVTA